MTISNVCIKDSAYTTYSGTQLLYEADDGTSRDVRLCWATQTGSSDLTSSYQTYFVYIVAAKGYVRGVAGETVAKTYKGGWDASECTCAKSGSLYWWTHDLDVSTLLADMAGSTWDYGDRTMDRVEFAVTMNSNYYSAYDGAVVTNSGQVSFSCSVEWIPARTVTGIAYTSSDTLSIYYDTTWERPSDHMLMSITGLEIDGEIVLNEAVRGYIVENGVAEVPVRKLKRHIVGETAVVDAPVAAMYGARNYHGAIEGSATVEMGYSLDAPALELVESGDAVSIQADCDGADGITIKLVGGKYSFDTVTVEPGGTASFPYVPLGVDNTFQAVAYDANGASGVSELTVAASSPGGIVIDSIEDGRQVRIEAREVGSDHGPTVDTAANTNTLTLAGRRRPSVFYGEGGTSSVSFEGVVIDGDGLEFEELPERGIAMCRFLDGSRYVIAPKVARGRVSERVVSISVSGEEVDA